MVIAAIVCLLTLSSVADATEELAPRIHEAIDAFLRAEWGAGNVEWEVVNASSLLGEITDESVRVEGKQQPRGTVLVQLYEGDRRSGRRYPVSIRVTSYALVPVASKAMKRGEPLDPGSIDWQRRDVTQVRDVWPETIGELRGQPYRIRRTVSADEVLTWQDIELVPDVVRGAQVTILSRQGQVEVSVPGIAMQDGREGDWVRVENRLYRKTMQARVVSQGTVLVGRSEN